MNDKKTIHLDPIQRLYKFIGTMDLVQREQFGMNYSIRGSFISIYLKVDPMLELVNYMAQKGRLEDNSMIRAWAVEHGYSPTDTYFRAGPYTIRIARYKEKIENNHDIGWLQETMGKEIRNLKQELASAVSLMEYHKAQLEEMRQANIKPKKRKK